MMNESEKLQGLGGWLVLVGIGIVVSPLRIAFIVLILYVPIFTDGTWEALTTAGAENYHPLWAPLLIGELAFNSALVLASCYLAYLFFTKQKFFPQFFIGVVLASVVFIPLDAWVTSFVLTDVPVFDPETTMEFARTLVYAIVWIPYVLTSKRVKATFVNPPSEPSTMASL
jgi:hypothetical protein